MLVYLLQGGLFMVPLVTCSVMAAAIILDRVLYLRGAFKEANLVLNQVGELAERSDVDGIEGFCQENQGLLSAIFLIGVRKFKQLQDNQDPEFVQAEVSKVMEEASIVNTADLENRLPLLSTIGNVAPLFGFAGTVTGMMNAFDDIAQTSNPSAQVVAAGIREALVTTATGLLIAIPVVLVYSYLTSRIDSINTRTEETANAVVDLLVVSHVKSISGAKR